MIFFDFKFLIYDDDLKSDMDCFEDKSGGVLGFDITIYDADSFRLFVETFKRLVYFIYLTSRGCWNTEPEIGYYVEPCLKKKSVSFSEKERTEPGILYYHYVMSYTIHSRLICLTVSLYL